MQYMLKKTYCPNQESTLRKHGDKIWDLICDELPADQPFVAKDVASLIQREFGWAESTARQYTRAFIANCLAMPEGGLFRLKGRRYRFHDVNGM